LGCFKI